jgi:predicted esterase
MQCCPSPRGAAPEAGSANSLFVRLISHQPAVLFSQNKSATNNQTSVLFSHSKSTPAISHQLSEHAVCFSVSSL